MKPAYRYLLLLLLAGEIWGEAFRIPEGERIPKKPVVRGVRGWGGNGFGGQGGFGGNGFGGQGGFGGGGFGGQGGFGGGGGGGGQGGGQSRKAADEISKLGQEASKGIQENLKTFSSGQEKSMQNFFNSLKDTQIKEDNQKLLESLAKESTPAESGGSSISSITDSIVKAIDDNSKTRIQIYETIGDSIRQMSNKPGQQPQQRPQTNENLKEQVANLPGRRGPLGNFMNLSEPSKTPSEDSPRAVRPYNSPSDR